MVDVVDTKRTEPRNTLKIFRAADAKSLFESECMSMEQMERAPQQALAKAVDAGILEGDKVTVLTQMPGFSLVHAWFKKDYPLPRHSHNADCMYYVVAGSLRLGTEELVARDCFFVPAGVPYTYTPGPDGVEILEVRHNVNFNFVNLAYNETFWNKAAETCAENLEDWKNAVPPSELLRRVE